jgi:hypothetical protein
MNSFILTKQSVVKQLLVGSILILPDELLRIVKDYVFYDGVQYQSKINKDHHLHMMIQMYNMSEILFIDDNDSEFTYHSKIHNCSSCGGFMCRNLSVYTRQIPENIPRHIQCLCR